MEDKPLTSLQFHTLGVLVDVGPADAEEVERHTFIDARRLGPVFGSLESRGLIQRTYTLHGYNRHAYYATDRGVARYAEECDRGGSDG